MAFNLEIIHLCVGQGLSVLIELTYIIDGDDEEERKYVALLDLGSFGSGQRLVVDSLPIIAGAVNRNEGVIDYVHVSHFDIDHYNNFKKLSDYYYKEHQHNNITINHLVLGSTGNHLESVIRSFLKCFKDYNVNRKYDLRGFIRFPNKNPYVNGENRTFPNININLGNNIYFRINTLLYHTQLYPSYRTSDHSLAINMGSSIILVIITYLDIPLFSFLFTGDATRLSFDFLLRKCDYIFQKELKLMTISHHGAVRHIADNDVNDYRTLNDFLEKYKPNAAVVSAKCRKLSGWTHPNTNTIDAYNDKVKSSFSHILTAFEKGLTKKSMIVKQKILNKMVYATFELDTNKVRNNAEYEDYYSNQSYHIFYDIVTVFSSNNPNKFEVYKIRRKMENIL